MKNAFELLRVATETWPPSPGTNHALMVMHGKLTLQLSFREVVTGGSFPSPVWYPMVLDAEDLEKTTGVLIQEITQILLQFRP